MHASRKHRSSVTSLTCMQLINLDIHAGGVTMTAVIIARHVSLAIQVYSTNHC